MPSQRRSRPRRRPRQNVDRYTYDPLAHDPLPPPLTIDLPQGWTYAYDAIVLQDIDGIRPIPFALYSGPVTGGTGDIVLLWGFPNLVAATASGGRLSRTCGRTRTRLLRLAIFEAGLQHRHGFAAQLQRRRLAGDRDAVRGGELSAACPTRAAGSPGCASSTSISSFMCIPTRLARWMATRPTRASGHPGHGAVRHAEPPDNARSDGGSHAACELRWRSLIL